jgi:hypothetical protein
MHWGYMNQFLQVGKNNDVVGLKLKNDEYGYADKKYFYSSFFIMYLALEEYFLYFLEYSLNIL